jgi:NADH-quinone oxidoreductase subunit M
LPSELAWNLPDVARELTHGHTSPETVLGLPAPRGLFVLAIVTAAALSLAAPFHRVGAELARETDVTDAVMAVASYSLAGGFVLIRFGVLLVPEAARWGAPALATLGAITLIGSIARAAIDPDLRGLAGVLPSASGGAAWLMASSLTPQGTQGAISLAVARPLATALLLLCAGALVSRSGDGALSRWGGVARSAPLLATALLVAVAASAAVPGGAAFWGAWLGLVGIVGRAPVTALVLAIGLAATAAAHARLWRVLGGPASPAWERSPALEPFGGTVPDLREGRDRGWAFILVGALVVLTLSPRAWLGVTNQVVLDALPVTDPPGPTQVASL